MLAASSIPVFREAGLYDAAAQEARASLAHALHHSSLPNSSKAKLARSLAHSLTQRSTDRPTVCLTVRERDSLARSVRAVDRTVDLRKLEESQSRSSQLSSLLYVPLVGEGDLRHTRDRAFVAIAKERTNKQTNERTARHDSSRTQPQQRPSRGKRHDRSRTLHERVTLSGSGTRRLPDGFAPHALAILPLQITHIMSCVRVFPCVLVVGA